MRRLRDLCEKGIAERGGRRCRIAPQLFRCPGIGDGRPVSGDRDSAPARVLQPQARAPELRLPALVRGRPPQRPARVAPTRDPRGLDGPRNGTRHPLRARYHTRMSKRKLRGWNPRGLRGVPADFAYVVTACRTLSCIGYAHRSPLICAPDTRATLKTRKRFADRPVTL